MDVMNDNEDALRRAYGRIAELEESLADVAMFLDGWFMPDDECQNEADALQKRIEALLMTAEDKAK